MDVRTRSDLFDVDPNDFVSSRDQLARQLKGQGNADEAAAVRKLRRPTVAVWAVNQVARHDAGLVEALLERAADARTAQRDAIAEGKPERLRDALAQRRAALSAVAKRARAVLEQSGRSGDTQERDIDAALTALVASDRTDRIFRAGELTTIPTDEAEAGALLSDLAQSLPARGRAEPPARPPSKELMKARTDLETRRAEAADADRTLDAAEAAHRNAEAALRAARKARETAHRAVDRASARVARLEP